MIEPGVVRMAFDLRVFLGSLLAAGYFWYEVFEKGFGNTHLPMWGGLVATVLAIVSIVYQVFWHKRNPGRIIK